MTVSALDSPIGVKISTEMADVIGASRIEFLPTVHSKLDICAHEAADLSGGSNARKVNWR
jgi:hypothetical protein